MAITSGAVSEWPDLGTTVVDLCQEVCRTPSSARLSNRAVRFPSDRSNILLRVVLLKRKPRYVSCEEQTRTGVFREVFDGLEFGDQLHAAILTTCPEAQTRIRQK